MTLVEHLATTCQKLRGDVAKLRSQVDSLEAELNRTREALRIERFKSDQAFKALGETLVELEDRS
jgi:prefoldin subunit 5